MLPEVIEYMYTTPRHDEVFTDGYYYYVIITKHYRGYTQVPDIDKSWVEHLTIYIYQIRQRMWLG